jgi:hypothetical protein
MQGFIYIVVVFIFVLSAVVSKEHLVVDFWDNTLAEEMQFKQFQILNFFLYPGPNFL